MSLLSFLRRIKCRGKHQEKIQLTIKKICEERLSLLIEHPSYPGYCYGIITDLIVNKRLILITDLTPDFDISVWKTPVQLKLSTSPKKGINYEFVAQFNAIYDQDNSQYTISLPNQIQLNEMRQVPRVKVGVGHNIKTLLRVENPLKVESGALKSIIADGCDYDGILYDISNQGLQILLEENYADILTSGMRVSAKIIIETISLDMTFDLEIRWCHFDSLANLTRVGSTIHNPTPEKSKALAYLLATIQANTYHRYI